MGRFQTSFTMSGVQFIFNRNMTEDLKKRLQAALANPHNTGEMAELIPPFRGVKVLP